MPKTLFEFNRSSRWGTPGSDIEIREAVRFRPQNWFEKYVGGWSGGSVVWDSDGKWFPTSVPFEVLEEFTNAAYNTTQTKPLDLSCHTQWAILPVREHKGQDKVLEVSQQGPEALQAFIDSHFEPVEG